MLQSSAPSTPDRRENGITVVQMRGDQSMNPELSAELKKEKGEA